jgi:hypothetical protein
MNTTQDNNRSRQGRIPATLQAVFLASNRGKEVNKPPPAAVASKVFFRNWLFQHQTGSKKEKGGILFGGSKKNKKSTKSKNQPQKAVLQERVAQTPKVKVCKAESPFTFAKWDQALALSILYLAHTPIFFSLFYSPLSRP